MPGRMEHVEGEIKWKHNAAFSYLDVEGLQAIFEKWVGKTVSITVEEVDE